MSDKGSGVHVTPEQADRPLTTGGMLRWVAEYLDLADTAALLLAADRGVELVLGTKVQEDLLAMAAWFDANPEAAQSCYAYVESTDTPPDLDSEETP